jgi:hypothetical protein
MKNQNSEKTEKEREKPPIFSSWSRLYAVVLLHLVFLIILFYLFAKTFE